MKVNALFIWLKRAIMLQNSLKAYVEEDGRKYFFFTAKNGPYSSV